MGQRVDVHQVVLRVVQAVDDHAGVLLQQLGRRRLGIVLGHVLFQIAAVLKRAGAPHGMVIAGQHQIELAVRLLHHVHIRRFPLDVGLHAQAHLYIRVLRPQGGNLSAHLSQLGIAHAVGDVAGAVVGDGDLPQALFVGGADIVGDGAGTVGIGGVGVVIVEHSVLCGQIVHDGSSCR